MKQNWVKGLTPKQKEEVEADFKAGVYLRKRLTELLNEKVETNRTSVRVKDAYSNPNWAFLQADAVGYERALYEVMSLISGDEERTAR